MRHLFQPVVSLILVAWLLAACMPAPTPAPTLPSGPLGDLPPALAGAVAGRVGIRVIFNAAALVSIGAALAAVALLRGSGLAPAESGVERPSPDSHGIARLEGDAS